MSFFHLPNLEAPAFEENGKWRSGSRWFHPMPDRVLMPDNSYIDLYIGASAPSLSEIVFQPAWLFSLKTQKQKWGAFRSWIKGSFADKPVNHLYFAKRRKGVLNVSETADPTVRQTLTTLRVRQTVLSVEWGLDYEDFSSVFSVENNQVKETDGARPEYWTFINQRENLTYFSALLMYRPPSLLVGRISDSHFVRLGWIKQWFRRYNPGAGDDKGPPPSVLARYPILDGVKIDWRTELWLRGQKKAVFDLSYRLSFWDRGRGLSAKALYHISPGIYSRLDLDILSAKGNKDYFLSLFRHNDYISWSLGCLF